MELRFVSLLLGGFSLVVGVACTVVPGGVAGCAEGGEGGTGREVLEVK